MADSTADLRALARAAAAKHGIDPDLFERQMQAESHFNPAAVSPAGARGVAQIMPGTAAGWGVDPHASAAAIEAAAAHMREYRDQFGGDHRKALVAYHNGAGGVSRFLANPQHYPKTRSYVDTIMGAGPAAPRPIEDLGKAVKARWPGRFDDKDDADVGERFQKYWQQRKPGAYSNFARLPAPAAAPETAAAPNAPRGTSAPPAPWQQPVAGLPRIDASAMPPAQQPVRPPSTADIEAGRQEESRLAAMTPDQRRHEIAVRRAFPEAMGSGVAGPPAKGEVPFTTAESRIAEFERQPPAARAAIRFGKGVLETLPGFGQDARGRTAAVPQATTTAGRAAEGLGGGLTFMAESALLTAAGAPEAAAAALPALAQPASLEHRLVGAATFGVAADATPAITAAISDLAVGGVRGIEGTIARAGTEAEAAALKAGAEPEVARLAGSDAEKAIVAKLAARRAAIEGPVGAAVGPAVFGGAAPWAQVAAEKLIGDKNAQWPTARETLESLGLLVGIGAGTHLAGAAGSGIRDLAARGMGRATPETPAPPGRPAWMDDPGKAAAFEAIRRHISDPGVRPGTPNAEHAQLIQLSRSASADLATRLQGKRVVFVAGGQRVEGDFAYGRVFPYPGEPAQVRLLIRDPASDQLVPFAFKDVDALRKAMFQARRPPLTEPATAAQARTGLLRLTQPGVPEALVRHFSHGERLHPVADDAITRGLAELSGVVRSREVRELAGAGQVTGSGDPATFRARLTALIRERLPEAVPARAEQLPTHEVATVPPRAEEPLTPKEGKGAIPKAGGAPVGGSVPREAPQPTPKPETPPAGPVVDEARVRAVVDEFHAAGPDEQERFLRNLRVRAEGEGQQPERAALAKRVLEEIDRRKAEAPPEPHDEHDTHDEQDVRAVVDEFHALPAEERARWLTQLRGEGAGEGEDADFARLVRARIFEEELGKQPEAQAELEQLLDRDAPAEEIDDLVDRVLSGPEAPTAEPRQAGGATPEAPVHGSFPGGGSETNASIADLIRKRRAKEVPGGTQEAGPGAPAERRGPGPGRVGGGAERGEPRGGAPGGAAGEPGDILRREWEPKIVEARAEHSAPADESVIPGDLGRQLRTHQRQSVAKMWSAVDTHGGGLLASGTGAGKTRVELAVAEMARRKGHAVLIVSPSQVIKQSWEEFTYAGDFKKSADAMGVSVKLWNEKYGSSLDAGHIYITTLEQVKNIKPDANLVLILDESHKFKNPGSQRTQAMLKLIDKAKGVLAASATPKDTIQNLHYLAKSGILEGGTFKDMLEKLGLRLVEAKIARDLKPGEEIEAGDRVRFDPFPKTAYPRYPVEGDIAHVAEKDGIKQYTLTRETKGGKTRTFLVDESMGDFKKFEPGTRIVPKKDTTMASVHAAQEQLFDRMTAAGRMVRYEISLEGVPLHITTIPGPADLHEQMAKLEDEVTEGKGADSLPQLQKARVKMLLRRHLEHLKVDKAIAAARQMVKDGRQVVIFADRVNESTPNKFERRLVDGQWQVVKIPLDEFTTAGTMPTLKKKLEAAGLTVAEIHGGVSSSEQLEGMRNFQAGDADVVIATPYSGGTGIDLDHQDPGAKPRGMILMTAPFDAMNYAQAIGRVVRLETLSRPQIAVLYIDHPIDTWGRDIITRKMRDLGATVKGQVPVLERGQEIGEAPEFETNEARAEINAARGARRARNRQTRGAARSGEIPITPPPSRVPTAKEAKGLPTATVPPVAEGFKEGALDKIGKALHEGVAILNPVHYATESGLDQLMASKGELDKKLFRTQRAYGKFSAFWEGRSREQVMHFWDTIEHGGQHHPVLEKMAENYRQRADAMFQGIHVFKDVPYFDNWFPHLWTKPDKAREFFIGRRPMEGTKSFLRKRFFQDIRAGIEHGLIPASWNPEEVMQLAEANARKFVSVQHLLHKVYKPMGLMVYVRVFGKPPAGYVRLDQPWTKVYMNPNIQLHEYYDQRVMDGLMGVAQAMGLKVAERTTGAPLGLRNAIGAHRAHPNTPGEMQARFATPLDVVAHEIGHGIDSKYNLQNTFLRQGGQFNQELQDLADLRAGPAASAGFKRYVRKAPEKMAVMLQALIHTPEDFKRVAPHVYERFEQFLGSRPELAPLLQIRPSLLYGQGESSVHAGGLVQGGEYWAEPNLARLINNYMSRDLVADHQLGRGVLAARNALNALNLGLSGFHATGTTLLAVMHRGSVGLSDVAHGRIASGMLKLSTAPLAPILYSHDGWKFFLGDPEAVKIEKDLFTGGAALHRRQYFQGSAFDNFLKNTRSIGAGSAWARTQAASKALAYAPWFAVEAPMRLLTSSYIPQIKVAAFRDLFSSQMEIKAKDLAAGRITREAVARLAWRDVEDRFGLLNYDNLFWNNTLKSAVIIAIRAPGWKLGTIRALGGGLLDFPRAAMDPLRGKPPDWTPRMSFTLSMLVTSVAAAGIYHYLHTGRRPKLEKGLQDWQHPENGQVDERGRPIRIDFPTYMKDVHNLKDPVKYLVGSIDDNRAGTRSLFHGGALAPEIPAIIELLENQGHRGPIRNLKASDATQAAQVMRYLWATEQPFVLQQPGIRGNVTHPRKLATGEAVESFFGMTRHYEPRPARPDHTRFREKY